jgi:hypothetical protein
VEGDENVAKLNLDARRAARSEAENEPHEVILGGHTFRLKPRMPLEFIDLLVSGVLSGALRVLLVDPKQWEALLAAGPDDGDLADIAALYGVSVPESQGSAPSSTNGGPSSNPTLPSDITSTLQRSVMDQVLLESAGSSPSSEGSPLTPARPARSTGRRGETGKNSSRSPSSSSK